MELRYRVVRQFTQNDINKVNGHRRGFETDIYTACTLSAK